MQYRGDRTDRESPSHIRQCKTSPSYVRGWRVRTSSSSIMVFGLRQRHKRLGAEHPAGTFRPPRMTPPTPTRLRSCTSAAIIYGNCPITLNTLFQLLLEKSLSPDSISPPNSIIHLSMISSLLIFLLLLNTLFFLNRRIFLL
jgi:hypothetical protein